MASPQLVTDPATAGLIRLVGGPGTGKTSMLVDAAAARIAAGADPESVLLLCPSARAATATRRLLSSEWVRRGGPAAIRAPLVRTVHSYAFAVVRLAAQRAGDSPPRLVTSAEQDGVIRELLAGDVEDGANAVVSWPTALRPALRTAGFAAQLRDLLSRCAERGVDGRELARLGRRAGRTEWVAAGAFAQQYEQVMLLGSAVGMAAPQATVPVLGAAELVGAALESFAIDDDLLAAERARVRVLLVDDVQHLDPQAARLVRVLAAGADVTVLAGDPNQTVFAFRGADSGLLVGDQTGHTVTLTRSHRCTAAVAGVVSGIAARLPGRPAITAVQGAEGAGSVAVRVAASEQAQAALIADALRRAHLRDGVPWTQMAVIVRSLPRAGALPRALAAAGVPVYTPGSAAAPTDEPVVQALLTVLAASATGLTPRHALALVTGPIGRVDPVSLRRLRRRLTGRDNDSETTGFGQMLIDALTGDPSVLPAALRRVRVVLDAAGATDVPGVALWQAWSRSGLPRRLLDASARGVTAGAHAERSLDAVVALFDIADDYVAHTSAATVRGLVDHVGEWHLPAPDREPLRQPDAVAVVSAHTALGREWDLVVIAGLQEGLWPNTVPRDGVLGIQRLLDMLDGVADTASSRAPVLADERRLLVSALGRARKRLLITAVDGEATGSDDAAVPSAFVDELRRFADDGAVGAERSAAPRVLAPAALVGRLRAVVCAAPGDVSESQRECAAIQLKRLATAGVPGANPGGWYGMATVSTDEPVADDDAAPVTLSPSRVQVIADCPLRWLLERHGGADGNALRSALGSVVHALIADGGKSEQQMIGELENVWAAMPFEANWFSRNELVRHKQMVSAFCRWRADSRRELTEVGTEVDVDGVLESANPRLPDVRVRGRVDRLERDAVGRLVVIDVKTGKTAVTKDDAARHAQLATYQLAVAAGLVAGLTAADEEPGGGRLVYLGKPDSGGLPVERDQDALTADGRRDWRQVVHEAAAATVGPAFLARVNGGCRHCPVRSSCPAQERRP